MESPASITSPVTETSGLKGASLSWVNVAALGVAIAVSGSFSGWNYGLALGGWGGMFVAALAMAALFFCITQCLAELCAAMPEAAGFDAYVRAVLGPTAGYLAGMAVGVGLAVATGLAVSFTAAYSEGMLGIGGWPVKGGLLLAVLILQLRGAREAVGLTMIAGAFALCVLMVFCVAMAPHFRAEQLLNTADANAGLFTDGWVGTFRCVPFALFLFLGVEQAAQAVAEMKEPARSMPKALITAISVVFLVGMSVLLIATGAAGVQPLSNANDPLLAAVFTQQPQGALSRIVGTGALVSLLATFFSLAYAASRQLYHLASAGDLPGWFARANSRGAPSVALIVVTGVGSVAAAFPPDSAMVVFIFLLGVAYELLLIAFLRFCRIHANLARPYRAIGGSALGWIGAALGLGVLISCYQLQVAALSWAVAIVGVLLVYFVIQRRAS